MTTRTIAVVTAGLSQPSSTRLLADRLAAATSEGRSRPRLGAGGGGGGLDASVEVVELRDVAHDLTDNLLTGFPSPKLRSAIDTVVGADGLIAVTPIFAAS